MTPPKQVLAAMQAARRGKFPNAKRPEYNGIKFRSQTELHFYQILERVVGQGNFEYERQIELDGPTIPRASTPKKRAELPLLADRCAEAVTLKVDFIFAHEGIEYFCDTKPTKELATATSRLKYDMLKRRLYNAGRAHETKILFVTMAEVKALALYAHQPKEFWLRFKQLTER